MHRRRRHILMIFLVVVPLLYLYHTYPTENEQKKIILLVNRTYSGLSCYEVEGERMPEILNIKSLPKKSIFFLEVTCNSINNGKIVILPRQACAVETAAYTNPHSDIYLLYTSPGLIKDEGTISDRLLQRLMRYKNVKIMYLDFKNLIRNTPVETLYQSGKIQNAKFPMVAATDIARLLTLQKYGGTYLDMDVMVLRSLDQLSQNYASIQSEQVVNHAIFSSSNNFNSSGNRFIQLCLKELQNHFETSNWASTGPWVATRVIKKMCKQNNFVELHKADCGGFKIYPTETFHPIAYTEWLIYFNGTHSQQQLNNILSKSYAIHTWNSQITNISISSKPDSIYNIIAKKYCPMVFKEAGTYF